MPLYEYECVGCGRRIEIIQRVGAAPVGACEECGGEMRRLLSAPAFQFKGSGWYVTDYAKKGSATSDSGERKPASGTEGARDKKSDAVKSESKPKPKTET